MRNVHRYALVCWIALAVLSLDAFGGIPDPDGRFHGCYDQQSGVIRVTDPVISGCAATEVPITWYQAVPGASGGQLRVVDVNGAFVGYLLGANLTVRNVDGIWVKFSTSPTGFNVDAQLLYYADDKCEGTAYIRYSSTALLSRATPHEGKLWYGSDKSISLASVRAREVKTNAPLGPCNPTNYTVVVSEARTLDVGGLVPPFRVE